MYLDGEFERISSHSKGGKVYLTMDDDPNAVIKTNAMGLKHDAAAPGETMVIDGLRLEHKSEGIWQLGDGGAEYDFRFSSGNLIIRPRKALGAE
jgi:hypothetical protein